MEKIIVFVAAEAYILSTMSYCFSKSKFLPFPHGAIAYLALLEMGLFIQSSGIADYRFLEIYSSYYFEENFIVCSLYLLFISTLIAISCPRGKGSVATSTRDMRLSNNVTKALIIGIYIHLVLFLFFLDWQKAWMNDTYMLMGSAAVLNGNGGIYNFLGVSASLAALLTAAAFFYTLFSKEKGSALLLGPAFLWHVAYQIGSHSRMSGVMFAIGALLAFRNPRTRIWSGGLIILSIVCLCQALAARALGVHGLASVFDVPRFFVLYLSDQPLDIILNLCEGVFVSSEIFARTFIFDNWYAILSFSPFPSFIDNFSIVNYQQGQGLHKFVPISAIHEAYSFGIPHLVLFIATEIAAGLCTARLVHKQNSSFSIMLNAVVLLGFATQFAYPVRSTYRFFCFPLAISAILLWKRSNNHNRKAAQFA